LLPGLRPEPGLGPPLRHFIPAIETTLCELADMVDYGGKPNQHADPMTQKQKQIGAWLDAMAAEIERRQAAKLEAADGDPRAWLTAKLEEMSQRMRAAPDWVEPTPDEQAQSACAVDVWFREHGYGR
jgi:hypothetical protein